MESAIPRDSTLRISLGMSGPYRIGEVIAFVKDSGICVHRVAYLGHGRSARDYIVTQGDACFYPDPPLHKRCVLGPVTEFHSKDRWFPTGLEPTRNRAQSPLGRTLLKLISWLMELNVRAACLAAKLMRVRKEGAAETTNG